MRLLLDTHTLLWWLNLSNRLSSSARASIADGRNEISVSVISAFEIATKNRIGKLPDVEPLIGRFAECVRSEQFAVLPLSLDHALAAGAHVVPHKDPFDRMLAAQALVEELTIISIDDKLDQFGVRRLW